MSTTRKKASRKLDHLSNFDWHEIEYLSKKHELPPPLVQNVIRQVGPSRTAVDNYLARMKRNGR